jgi:hypothetical protein
MVDRDDLPAPRRGRFTGRAVQPLRRPQRRAAPGTAYGAGEDPALSSAVSSWRKMRISRSLAAVLRATNRRQPDTVTEISYSSRKQHGP